MRAVIQTVRSATCVTDGGPTVSIRAGILVYLGIDRNDTEEEATRLTDKIRTARIVSPEGEPRFSAPIDGGEILCVSSYTLLSVTKGTRLGFSRNADPETAAALYALVCDGLNAVRGSFGKRMAIQSDNDGPTVLIFDTESRE